MLALIVQCMCHIALYVGFCVVLPSPDVVEDVNEHKYNFFMVNWIAVVNVKNANLDNESDPQMPTRTCSATSLQWHSSHTHKMFPE